MSRQAMLDDPASAFPQLHQFLGGYFHQDWPVDSDGWENVVRDFVAEAPASVVLETSTELRALLAAGYGDGELEAMVEGLGGDVDPAAFNLRAEEWLRALLESLANDA
jgi:hypothetical protein